MNNWTRKLPLLFMAILLVTCGISFAGTISVAWDPVSDPDLAGYKVYYGTAPGVYDQVEDVGNVTSTTLVGLNACTRYYIAIKAYDNGDVESANYSNQIDGLPRPVVTASDPASGEQGASLTVSITGESYVDGATVEFSGGGISVSSTSWVSCNELTAAIVIDSGAATGARNITVVNPDNSFGTGSGLFTVSANATPTVTAANPASGATGVAISVHPRVTFSERMAPAGITSNNVRLLDESGTPIAQAAGSPSLSADGLTATITPASDLDYTTVYHTWVRGGASGVTDESGNPMASDWNQNPGFTTAESSDTEGPQVSSTAPADGATGVAASVQPTVTFNEPVDPSTVTQSTVRLLDAGGAPVAQSALSPQLSGDGLTATIIPAATLGELATYKIQVIGGASGVKDEAGNPMDATWTQTTGFTTANLPPSNVQNNRRTDVK